MFLDQVYRRMRENGTAFTACADELLEGLRRTRASMPADEWKAFTVRVSMNHPLRPLLLEDPFTRRAAEKPRGYAGDAVMIDYIYGHYEVNGTSKRGQAILDYLLSRPLSQAVRNRRDTLTRAIDDMAAERPDAEVLALACGHLREAMDCKAIVQRRLGRFVALDHDPKSLRIVDDQFGACGVVTVCRSVFDMSFDDLGRFDLIYSAGLYDYIWQGAAKQLTSYVFAMLKPGGRLLIANVTPEEPDAGYMEAIMDWWLIYRTDAQLAALAQQIPRSEIGAQSVFRDPTGCVAFLELVRA
ncbi:MAG TPA: class I SAM-dependent methyltransferase [Phycisphaerae bacterium]|nr:class I SAM-dependent methyltransferase [Phycisphaerae bacterium]HRY68080.1 class I SAM-dependent methyltransferase [Phycisphaerae bacterium]HSA29048.1 class I SAM-dependent methyltransferase [Phycisphaerae bacterium]